MTIVNLNDLTANPSSYKFFTFRPNLKKLILSGSADAEHISILWYTAPDGSVGRHHHSMTESVYVIDGTQADAQGVYPTGSLYFNPPGSSHEISDSTGFFLLAYASPPDFTDTDRIARAYVPVQINTAADDMESRYPFEEKQDNLWLYDVPLDPAGGMSSQLIKSTSTEGYRYEGNYLLVLKGRCNVNETLLGENMLIVSNTVAAQSYEISAIANQSCLVLGLSFLNIAGSQHSRIST